MVDPRSPRRRLGGLGGEGTVPSPTRGIALPHGGFVPIQTPAQQQATTEQLVRESMQYGATRGRAEATMTSLRLLGIPVPPEIQNGSATPEQVAAFGANNITATLVSGNLRRQIYEQLRAQYDDIDGVITAPPSPGAIFEPNASDPTVYVHRAGSDMRYRIEVTARLVEDPGPFGTEVPEGAALAGESEAPAPPPRAGSGGGGVK